jgi:hypothetical protein
MIAVMETTPLTSAEKMRRRRALLNKAAVRLGFETWAKLETAVRNWQQDNAPIRLITKEATGKVSQKEKPR